MAEPFGKFGSKRKKEYLEALREGNGRMAAARSVGVSNELIRLYRQAHPEFIEKENEAQDEANESIEDALFQAATSGNVTACQVWLYNRLPDRWKDKRNVEYTGKDGGPIPITSVVVVRPALEHERIDNGNA